jgi:hypothetical protein
MKGRCQNRAKSSKNYVRESNSTTWKEDNYNFLKSFEVKWKGG